MQDKPPVGLYLDTRSPSKKHEGKFHVKVRITWEVSGKWAPKYVLTKQFVTVDEFAKIEPGKAVGTLREKQEAIYKIRAAVKKIIDEYPRITIDQFFEIWRGSRVKGGATVEELFDEIIATKDKAEKISTALTYKNAKISILSFHPGLTFKEVTIPFIKEYENHMLTTLNRRKTFASLNSVGFHLRCLRAVMRIAVKRKLIRPEDYPFGENGYVIRSKKVVKKALQVDVKDSFLEYDPISDQEAEAVDFTLLSFFCNGMNFTDLAYLRAENFKGESFAFIRRKTRDTVNEQVEIEVHITPDIEKILARRAIYSPYVFGIINDKMSAKMKHARINQWIKNTNTYLKQIFKKLGYKGKVTTYSMRHTFTTILLNSGVPITKVKDLLGHRIITTTENYAEDLDIKTAKSIGNLLNPSSKKP